MQANPIIHGQQVINALAAAGQASAASIAKALGLLHPTEIKRLQVTLSRLKRAGRIDSAPNGNGLRHDYWLAEVRPAPRRRTRPDAPPAAAPAPAPGVTAHDHVVPIDLGIAVDHIAGAIAQALAAALHERLPQIVGQQVQQALDRLPAQVIRAVEDLPAPAAPPAAAPPPTPPKIAAPRVTIVGLLPGQVEMIKREFGKELHLSFVGSDEAKGPRLRSLSVSSQRVITMTSFINHAAEDLIKSAGGQLLRCSGGMSSLRDALTRIYCNETQETAG